MLQVQTHEELIDTERCYNIAAEQNTCCLFTHCVRTCLCCWFLHIMIASLLSTHPPVRIVEDKCTS